VKKRFFLWLMKTRFWHWLLISVIPYIRFTTYYTSLRGDKYHAGYRRLLPGDYCLAVDRKKATSLLVPGVMTHAALCWNRRELYDKACEIVEMTHHDFTHSDFFDICKESDRVVIMRCLDFDLEYINNVLLPRCAELQDCKYDVDFDLGISALYCSELVYQSDVERRLQVSLEDIAGLGHPYISPDGLMFAKNSLCVWDSDDEFTGLLGDEIKSKLCFLALESRTKT
jgi:hypothetical protein